MSAQAVGTSRDRRGAPCATCLSPTCWASLAWLAGTFGELVVSGGELVLSGILSGQGAGLVGAYAPWFRLEAVAREDAWVLLAGARAG